MKSQEVKKILGVTQRTLNNYIKRDILHPVQINKTHYEYDADEVYKLIGKIKERINVTYARVSLNKQKKDLEKQNQRLYDYCLSNGITINEQFKDIKSGMNFIDRKQFNMLLKLVLEYKVDKVIIENKDRLARFGFDLLKHIFAQYGTEIIVMSDVENKSYEKELTDDLISIIHHYSMKSYSYRRKLNAAEKALKETSEDN